MTETDLDNRPFTSYEQAFDWATAYFLANYRWGIASWIFVLIAVLVIGFCGTMLTIMCPSLLVASTMSKLSTACAMGATLIVAIYFRLRLEHKAEIFATEAIKSYLDEPITRAMIKQELKIYTTLERVIRPPRPKL